MFCAQADSDPFYEEPAAQWLRDRFENTLDIEFNIDESLTAPVAASRELRAIWVRPGLPLDEFHWLTGRAILYVKFGIDAAPEFITPIELIGAVALALIIPFQRALTPISARSRKR
jgi:hypothetical protein